MTIYIGGLVVEIRPAFKAALGVIHDGTVPMADAIVILIPWRDLVIRQEAVVVLDFGLSLGR